jgi:hypothetical protein
VLALGLRQVAVAGHSRLPRELLLQLAHHLLQVLPLPGSRTSAGLVRTASAESRGGGETMWV